MPCKRPVSAERKTRSRRRSRATITTDIPRPNLFVNLARATLLFDIENRVAAYLGAVFLLSLLADLIPILRIPYISDQGNFFNRYLVACSWMLVLLVPFVWLTAYVYCCGEKRRVLKHHLARLAVATCIWKLCTFLFAITDLISSIFRQVFDISGQCFVLIYGSLVLSEEARVMRNWKRIEEHSKVLPKQLVSNYKKYTPIVRGLFVGMAVLQAVWDVVLVVGLLFSHTMAEKFVGAAMAVGFWYLTYKCWYAEPCFLPRLPGDDVVHCSRTLNRTKQVVDRSKQKAKGCVVSRSVHSSRRSSDGDNESCSESTASEDSE